MFMHQMPPKAKEKISFSPWYLLLQFHADLHVNQQHIIQQQACTKVLPHLCSVSALHSWSHTDKMVCLMAAEVVHMLNINQLFLLMINTSGCSFVSVTGWKMILIFVWGTLSNMWLLVHQLILKLLTVSSVSQNMLVYKVSQVCTLLLV